MNIVIFLNCDLLVLDIRDSYKKRHCEYVSFLFLRETQIFKIYLTGSYKYCIIIAGSKTKIFKTHRLLNKILFSLCPFLCLLQLVLPVAFLNGRVFSFLEYSTQMSQVIIRVVYSFVFWFENGFLQVKPARYHCLHKKLCLQ